MYVVHIEHTVLDFDNWKGAFDSDPVGRAQAGVRRYRVVRAADDPDLVMIDLEFDSEAEADKMVVSLHALWSRIEGVLITGPQARVFDVVETVDL
jgi:hypothetical protein